jgi:hypothetical protein
VSLGDGGLSVKRQTRIDLRGNASRNDLQNLGAKSNSQLVKADGNLFFGIGGFGLGVFDGLLEQVLVLRQRRGLQQQLFWAAKSSRRSNAAEKRQTCHQMVLSTFPDQRTLGLVVAS